MPRKGCPGEGRAQASRHLCRAQFENIYLTHFTDETEVQRGIVTSLGSHSKMKNKTRVRTLLHIRTYQWMLQVPRFWVWGKSWSKGAGQKL